MAKQALILDGGTGDGATTRLAGDAVGGHLEGMGWSTTVLALRELEIAPCLGCFGCWVRTPGVCVVDDDGREVARRVVQSDLMVFVTPLTFGGYSSELKKALDRLIPIISPMFRRVRGEVHHVRRYARYPRLVGVAVDGDPPIDPEEEELFETLVGRNAINLYAPAEAACVVAMNDDPAAVRRTIEQAVGKVIRS